MSFKDTEATGYGISAVRSEGGELMEVGKILPVEAAAILHASPQFVRIAMQQGKLPIGTAIKMSSIWTYNISEKLLADYSGKDIGAELEKIRGGSK